MHQPPGFISEQFPNHVCLLKKALYGLKQAPRAWYGKVAQYLIFCGFKMSNADSSLFVKTEPNMQLLVLLYVDDMIVTGSDEAEISSLRNDLSLRFDMKNLGEVDCFLGLERQIFCGRPIFLQRISSSNLKLSHSLPHLFPFFTVHQPPHNLAYLFPSHYPTLLPIGPQRHSQAIAQQHGIRPLFREQRPRDQRHTVSHALERRIPTTVTQEPAGRTVLEDRDLWGPRRDHQASPLGSLQKPSRELGKSLPRSGTTQPGMLKGSDLRLSSEAKSRASWAKTSATKATRSCSEDRVFNSLRMWGNERLTVIWIWTPGWASWASWGKLCLGIGGRKMELMFGGRDWR
ncbi:putative mitochondrial protein [Senna tora]|uniref:Putative mitochondrial protein n=1 Tax=Senna tora TaxID=362788 RepID=A0A834TVV6_9FABA|nr:putative mitochondrial protein [Senna tora]